MWKEEPNDNSKECKRKKIITRDNETVAINSK